MDKYPNWYADGTFDISSTHFKQVYTLHVLIIKVLIPVINALMPNKKESSYKKLLSVLKLHLKNEPNSVNCDFEKGLYNYLNNYLN